MANTLFSISKKCVLFSGATGVLGKSMSMHLAKEGATLLILGRNESKVNSLVSEIIEAGGKAIGYVADVTSVEDLENVKNQIVNDGYSVDTLINAAGGNQAGAVITPQQNLLDLDIDALRKVIDLNYMGTILPVKTFLPLLLENGHGNIINISSMAASRPMTRVLGYASAKAGIDNLTKFLSVELAKKHGDQYRVNALAPGFFLTEQNRQLLTNDDGSLTERGNQIIEHTPLDRFGQPDDLLGAIHWLCSDASKFVTGTIVKVDGGFSAFSGV